MSKVLIFYNYNVDKSKRIDSFKCPTQTRASEIAKNRRNVLDFKFVGDEKITKRRLSKIDLDNYLQILKKEKTFTERVIEYIKLKRNNQKQNIIFKNGNYEKYKRQNCNK